jgi:acyl carrier protein
MSLRFAFINVNPKEQIRAIFIETFPNLEKNDFDWGQSQEDVPGWDSFGHLELISRVEQSFGLTLSFDESTSLESPRSVLALVNQKLKTRRS